MRAYFSETIADSFEMILEDLQDDPDFVTSPRGMEVREIRDCCVEVKNVLDNTYTNEFRSSQLKYIAAETLWYFSGTNNPAFIENYASLWKNIHNEDGTVNSAYGHLLFTEKNEHGLTQYEWVIESLKKDKDSRQAFMHFNKPRHQFLENKDQVCTLQALFHIRDNKLYMTVTMRSNDVIYGFMTDWTFFTILFQQVYMQMKEYYPELELGTYTHISHSMHLYQRHYELVKNMLTKPFKSTKIIPILNKSILNLDGTWNEPFKFEKIFVPIFTGSIPNFNNVQKTGNDLIDWCITQLKENETA
jgi:thymidylate synthase